MCLHPAHLWNRDRFCSEDLLLVSYSSSTTAIFTCNLSPWEVFLFINATEKPVPALWIAIPGDPP